MGRQMIVRVDDVNPNTDMRELNATCDMLHKEFGCEIWYCVNLFSSRNACGSVYPNLPMRGRGLDYFMDVDTMFEDYKAQVPVYAKTVSHGMLHAEHALMGREAQKLSIVTSCNYLKTDTFVPPFMSYNEDTLSICEQYHLNLINGFGWKSMEKDIFSPQHLRWYFHPWRINSEQMKELLYASKNNV